MQLAIIVAVSDNGVIGHRGTLPWHLRADLRRFKRLTMGHTLIMGRRTFESIGRPLPGRRSIVITGQTQWTATGCDVAPSFEQAVAMAEPRPIAFVIGGRTIYAHALPRVHRMYVTRVHATVTGDTTFPDVDLSAWNLQAEQWYPADAENDYPFTFQTYDRC